MIFEDQLAALEADSQEGRHAGRRARLRAAGRRPRRRARAGHHHRRRLPLLLHRQAQVHRRRHAGPRAVHAQHGHRRLDRRPRRDPDRRAQGRADPDAAPQLPRLAARHPQRRAGGQQDGPRRLRRRRSSTRIDADYRDVRRADRPRTTSSRSRCRRCRATTSPTPSEHTPWYDGPDAAWATSRPSRSRTTLQHAAVPHAGAVGQPARTSTSAASPARSPAASVAPGRPRSACCRRAARARSRASSPSTATSTQAVAGQSVTLTLADEIDVSRGDVHRAPPTRRRRSPTSSRRRSSGWPRSRCCPAGPTC